MSEETTPSWDRDHSRPEQQAPGTRVRVDVVLPRKRQLAVGADPENREARRDLSRAAAVADNDRALVADNQDASRRIERERARMVAARVDRLDQGRLAGVLVDRIDRDRVLASGRDASAVEFDRRAG